MARSAPRGSAWKSASRRSTRRRRCSTYATITVPFEGIITQRYADPGALIQAGTASNTQSMPLVDLAQQDLLRLVFPVPESAAPLIRDRRAGGVSA